MANQPRSDRADTPPDDKGHDDRPDILIQPPILGPLVFCLALGLDWLVPLEFLGPIAIGSAQFWLGVVLAGLAGLLGFGGGAGFRNAGTNIPPHLPATALVTTGIYGRLRNPMYLGMQLLLVALGLVFSLEWCLLLWPILALALHFGVVRREETYLAEKFGEPYRDYCNRVRRWGPF